MNHACAYVIGLSPYHLLDIEYSVFTDYDLSGFVPMIVSIEHGTYKLSEASWFYSLDAAKEALEEIKERYDEISVCNHYAVDSIVDGDDFDPNKLHIYEVNIGMEVV